LRVADQRPAHGVEVKPVLLHSGDQLLKTGTGRTLAAECRHEFTRQADRANADRRSASQLLRPAGVIEAMVDWNWPRPWEGGQARPNTLKIDSSPQIAEWMRARREGDFEAMARILAELGCERPREVAHMFDFLGHRKFAFEKQCSELRKARFG